MLMNTDDLHFAKFHQHKWVGLTKNEVIDEMAELFGNQVRYEFLNHFRSTEEMRFNYVAFRVANDIVIEHRWG